MDVLRFKQANCKNCYKCVRFCPVKSIRVYQGHAQIISSDCILCGNCVSVCPQHAKEDISDVGQIRELIASGKQVVVSVDSSYIAYFDTPGFQGIEKPLKALGFTAAHETAEGAYLVKKELEKLAAQPGDAPIITSGCSTIVLYVEKHLPEALPYLAPVLSPMQAHAVLLRERYPGATIVYISPCISKKDEAEQYGQVDCVLTFDELIDWLAEEGIELPAGEQPDGTEARSRFFPTAGGIIRSMDLDDGFSYIPIDGLRRCMDALEEIERGGMQNCFVEMNACEGSCIGGPVMHRYHSAPITCKTRVEQYSGKSGRDFDDQPADDLRKSMQYIGSGAVKPGEAAIQEVLHKLGKYRPEDELNCGTCGYSTCREKAIAVCQGKADLTMCLPFLKARAESFSSMAKYCLILPA